MKRVVDIRELNEQAKVIDDLKYAAAFCLQYSLTIESQGFKQFVSDMTEVQRRLGISLRSCLMRYHKSPFLSGL